MLFVKLCLCFKKLSKNDLQGVGLEEHGRHSSRWFYLCLLWSDSYRRKCQRGKLAEAAVVKVIGNEIIILSCIIEYIYIVHLYSARCIESELLFINHLCSAPSQGHLRQYKLFYKGFTCDTTVAITAACENATL